MSNSADKDRLYEIMESSGFVARPQVPQKDPKKSPDIAVERSGDKIVVPANLPYAQVIAALQRRAEADESPISIVSDFDFGVAEGLIALTRVLDRRYGFASAISAPAQSSPFAPAKARPPEFIAIETAPGATTLVPWGRLALPGVDGFILPAYTVRQGQPFFQLRGEVKGSSKHVIDELVELIKAEQQSASIYRGQAIEVEFIDPVDATNITDFFPTFMDLADVDESAVIYSREVEALVRTALYTPIEHSAACRALGIPLKRGLLLEGPYGVGKTLTVSVAARKCVENGWTFIHVEDSTKIAQAFELAKLYQPALVFAEDIDQAFADSSSDDSDRSAKVNAILNAIDGIGAKNVEIMVVLTTNHVDKLTRALLRPGRIDTVVPVRAPDAEAAERMVRYYAGALLPASEDLTVACQLLAGKIPALIREVVERSKLSAVRRTQSAALQLLAEDIEFTARGMQAHMDLLEGAGKSVPSPYERCAVIEAQGRRDAAITLAAALAGAHHHATNGGKPNGAARLEAPAL